MLGVRIPQHDIGRERPHVDLDAFQFQVHLQRPAEMLRMFSQPQREITGLIRPDLPQRDLNQRLDLDPQNPLGAAADQRQR